MAEQENVVVIDIKVGQYDYRIEKSHFGGWLLLFPAGCASAVVSNDEIIQIINKPELVFKIQNWG